MTKETLHDRISKLGGTPFYAEDIEIQLDDGLIVSAANINALRREAVQKLLDAETQQAVEVLPFKAIQSRILRQDSAVQTRFPTDMYLKEFLFRYGRLLRILLTTGQELNCREGCLEWKNSLKKG